MQQATTRACRTPVCLLRAFLHGIATPVFVTVSSFLSIDPAVAEGEQKARGVPIIILILADDMGYADAGFAGSKDILTPNLDRLAASGVVYKQGYVNHPFCGPSRAALLSGRYQHRFGFETSLAYDPANPIMGIDPGEKLFPQRLREAGYVTGCIGKWHLGAAEPFHPNNRGFDYFCGFLGGGYDYFRIDLTQPVKEAYLQGLVSNERPANFEGYLTTALSHDASRFVETNKDKPFFLYLAYNAPHAPQQAPAEDIARYSHIRDQKRRIDAAMVDVMDRGIGEVITALKAFDLSNLGLVHCLKTGVIEAGSTAESTRFRCFETRIKGEQTHLLTRCLVSRSMS